MKKMFLLFLIFISKNSFAQCIVQPSCADMGYTQTIADCSDGKAIKCPFDTSKVICLNQEGSSSTTTPPSTPCVNGALVFTDGTCSYYESYETDDNPALGVYYKNNDTYAIWGGYRTRTVATAKTICAQEGGKYFTQDPNSDEVLYYSDVSNFHALRNGLTITFLPFNEYRTKNMIFVSPSKGRIYFDSIDSSYETQETNFYCYKKL